VKTSLAVLAAALVGVLAAVGAARLIEPSEPPVVPPIELREEPTQTSEKPRGKRPGAPPPRQEADPAPSPPPRQEADPAPSAPPVPAGDDDDDDDDDDDASDDAGESDD
jgi:hypothetical protein